MSKEEYNWDDKIRSLKEIPPRRIRRIVSQRKKGDPVIVKNDIIVAYLKKGERVKVELKVIATLEAWKKIAAFTLDHPDWFGTEFHSRFANQAVLEISEKNKPRGKQKKIHYFVNEIKISAGVLYAFFRYWCKQPIETLPGYLKKILDLCKKDEFYEDRIKTLRGNYNPEVLTEYCISKVYGESMQALGLLPKSFDHPDYEPINFYITYIQDRKRPTRIREQFLKNKTSQEIEELAYSIPVLRSTFKALHLI